MKVHASAANHMHISGVSRYSQVMGLLMGCIGAFFLWLLIHQMLRGNVSLDATSLIFSAVCLSVVAAAAFSIDLAGPVHFFLDRDTDSFVAVRRRLRRKTMLTCSLADVKRINYRLGGFLVILHSDRIAKVNGGPSPYGDGRSADEHVRDWINNTGA
ncbi:hypothetical protein [Jannaschia sp. CCS1]|uniref:hypothetical protein n=1 Tax=Jannaschia sp. (strain CCS1) TaxID=290400 RepID=UPI000053CFE6|nr:hypothetical protein [Jannaschia sp. CCS1]ABD53711.1 hypothetical protein Jann_0794 [Jannaschia sp. CCS1]